jgi:phenylacetate-CoA ligase
MTDLIRMLRLIRQYRRASGLPLEALRAVQQRRLEALVAHAQRHSPFHRERLAGLHPAGVALADLPTMDKATLMGRFDEIVCDPSLRLAELERFMAAPENQGQRYRGNVLIRTSGTSGRPVVVVYSAEAFDHVRAVNLARGSMVDASGARILQRALDPEALKIACVLMDGGFAPSHANFLHQPAASRWFIQVERISLRLPIDEIVARLERAQPQILFAYPSVLEQLAEEARAGRLDILRQERARVVSLSEPLSPRVRALAAEAFDAPVFDLYGAGECLPIARSCEHGTGLHINLDMVALEVVDDHNQPVPDGHFGSRVLITNLFNPLLPILRYELLDIAAITWQPCPCGSQLPRLLSVRGRSDELIWLPHPAGGRRVLHPYLVLETLLGFEQVLDWQLTQLAPLRLRLDLVLADGASPGLEPVLAAVRAELDELLPPGLVQLEGRSVDRIVPEEISGKVRRVVALAPPGQGAPFS